MNKADTLLTIIVPAYNVERYISECLDSLVNQTMWNHKIIIVNDGSKDNTEKICLDYQKRYPEVIKYIYQENQGLGEARNAGMKLVDTPYLCFLDSDDWLNIKYVEKFSQMIDVVDESPDMVFTLPWVYDTISKRIYPWKDKELYDRIFSVHDGKSFVQTNGRKSPELLALEVTSCRKIYRRDFLLENNFSFPKGLKWEDVPGHFMLVHQANTCLALPEVGFVYRVNQGGQITSGGGKTRLDLVPIFEQLVGVQRQFNFNKIEKAYVLRLIVDFSIWSVEVTNVEYIEELLKGLHTFFKTISDEEIDYYLQTISSNKNRERGFITLLKGKEYLKLQDYFDREKEINEAAKICLEVNTKHSVIRGGLQCICDHGISYTIIYMIRKYLFGKR